MHKVWNLRSIGVLFSLLSAGLMSGCLAQQADLKRTQQQARQTKEELAQTRARQSQEISTLREQELPQLRGELERALHQAQELQNKQEDLRQRSAVLEQQTRKLEQLASKMESESTTRYAWVQKSLDGQDTKNKEERDRLRGEVNSRLDEVNRQMELLRTDIIEAVQKTNAALTKTVDAKLDEQRKSLVDSQTRLEQLSGKFTQFSQALTGFRESLTTLNERVNQEEQATKFLSTKLDTDIKSSTTHVNETTKIMSGHLGEVNRSIAAVAEKLATRMDEQSNEVNKYMASVSQKLEARLNDQDQRLVALSKFVEQVAQEAQAAGGNHKGTSRRPSNKSAHRSSAAPLPEPAKERELEVAAATTPAPEPASQVADRGAKNEEVAALASATSTQVERPDKAEYERLLNMFRDGKLDEARRGFSGFLAEYPNSDLAPNARYWLGESYYGRKEYKQAIDSYDRVEVDYPQSDKVPAAILKKGYAYMALKDKKRASSAFKQVVTLYPKSPEAGKAYDKLNQLKEMR